MFKRLALGCVKHDAESRNLVLTFMNFSVISTTNLQKVEESLCLVGALVVGGATKLEWEDAVFVGVISSHCAAVCGASWSQGCQMAKFDPFFSLDCDRVEGSGAQSKERKGSNFAAQRSGAIVQKPEGPNTDNLKIWL